MNPQRHPRLPETLAMLGSLDAMIRELTYARNHTVVLALQRGASTREVARTIGVSHTSVQNLAARHVHWGDLSAYSRLDLTAE